MAQSSENALSGKLITFEGGEGAGKTTQLALLADRLEAQGLDVVRTREPGGTPAAEQIRQLLVTGRTDRWSALTEALLNFAARHEHLQNLILPALQNGQWVISDRFIDSTMAYQGMAGGVGQETIRMLQDIVLGHLLPDLTIILDLPVDQGLTRADRRGADDNRYERMDIQFHERLRQGFLHIAEQERDRCVVIDGTRSVEIIAKDIWSVVEKKFGPFDKDATP